MAQKAFRTATRAGSPTGRSVPGASFMDARSQYAMGILFAMNSAEYEQFTATLLRTLEEDPAVLGLVALGTMAEPTWRDAWSDHDFWVVTRPGHQDRLLDDLGWLPSSDTILVRARHGSRHCSVLYRSGHRAEFAVFDPEEAASGTVTVYCVLFDRADVAEVLARAVQRGRPQPWSEARGVFIF